jgi:hypothetical protein
MKNKNPFLFDHLLFERVQSVEMRTIFEQRVQFELLLVSETKESSNGSSGSCQGDGLKTSGNEPVAVCQRPPSSLSLHSISSEFSFTKF